MPSCPTKSFAAYRCLHGSPASNQGPLERIAAQLLTRQPRVRSALKRLESWVARCLSRPGSRRRTQPNSANRRAAPSPRNDDATRVRRQTRAIRPRDHRVSPFASAALALTVFVGAPLYAADVSAQYFSAGRSAFESQDYVQALASFEAAARAGMTGPAVHFNIGAAAYRAGRYERAEAAFIETARTPAMAALAHYNLGLIALRRGDKRSAARWFARAEQEAADERLRILAANQRDALPPAPERNWVGYASLGAGYDDNVALVSDAAVLTVSGAGDAFAETQLAVSAPLAQPWRLDANLLLTDYVDLDAFDQLSMQGGARYQLQAGPWTNDAILQFAYSTLDGEGFENKRMLGLQASRELASGLRMLAGYRYSDIEGMNGFTAISGERHEASARIDWRRGVWDLALEYGLESSDLEDAALSANRQALSLDVGWRLNNLWFLGLNAAVRASRYDSEDMEEDELELASVLARELSPGWRLVLRYAYADNRADLAVFDYGRSRITAAIEIIL